MIPRSHQESSSLLFAALPTLECGFPPSGCKVIAAPLSITFLCCARRRNIKNQQPIFFYIRKLKNTTKASPSRIPLQLSLELCYMTILCFECAWRDGFLTGLFLLQTKIGILLKRRTENRYFIGS